MGGGERKSVVGGKRRSPAADGQRLPLDRKGRGRGKKSGPHQISKSRYIGSSEDGRTKRSFVGGWKDLELKQDLPMRPGLKKADRPVGGRREVKLPGKHRRKEKKKKKRKKKKKANLRWVGNEERWSHSGTKRLPKSPLMSAPIAGNRNSGTGKTDGHG